MKSHVYNLEFRPNCTQMTFDGYVFERVGNYADKKSQLQSLVKSHGSEFSTIVKTGCHAHTANVTQPASPRPARLPWQHSNPDSLDDIVLLLALFTGRDVFVVPVDHPVEAVGLRSDPRHANWGGVLRTSIPYECEKNDDPYRTIDISLQVHLQKVLNLIGSDNWRNEFGEGYFLFLLRSALHQFTLESTFVQCWTIWEHLFACLTKSWLSQKAVRQLESSEKLSYVLTHFGLRSRLEECHHSRIQDLIKIRNRLIHYGAFPDGDQIFSDAVMFIRMTEWIAAKILGLESSEVFNTTDQLEEYLKRMVQNSK